MLNYIFFFTCVIINLVIYCNNSNSFEALSRMVTVHLIELYRRFDVIYFFVHKLQVFHRYKSYMKAYVVIL